MAASELNLTRRELQILVLLVEGSTDKEVANQLGISVHTARTHHKNILRKTDCHNSAGLISFALQNKLITMANLV